MNKSFKHNSQEPVAIIGIGCRFPGDANSPETFWKLLINGVDAISEVPADRFDIDAFYDPDPEKPGKVITRYGGFLKEIDKFDANFFGMSPWEAARLDPQQRLLLEVAWEGFEDAGHPLETLAGSRTGVFVGIYSSDYENRMFADIDAVDLYAATGSALYSAAGRLSYAFDLQGPSMAIGTACSSSLVSTHLALHSLRTGESEMAIAGGVNLILNPQLSIAYSKGRMLSPDGRCKFGDANANGFVRGEGCGIVVLKPLSRALEDGDRIYALIMGSAANNDGRRGHFLAPSPEGQAAVLHQAYCDAGVQPSQVHYIEAHGTGTSVGDPVEIETLNQVVGEQRPSGKPCLVGSVKTNFGHLESASGIAGLIKAAICLHHRQIAPSLHFHEPNPGIPWKKLNVKIQKDLIPLNMGPEPAIIGVNAFGLTGMNAHIVMQEAPLTAIADGHKESHRNNSDQAFLLPLSARSDKALSDMMKKWQSFLTTDKKRYESLYDICYNAGVKRTHHRHRIAIIGESRREIIGRLKTTDHKELSLDASIEEKTEAGKKGLVFVFSGQGPQWFAMGRDLLEQEPVFRKTVEHCADLMGKYSGWSLLDELMADESNSRLNQTEIAQPAIFALQIGLAALWQDWGIKPDAIIGHSIGEVAAACCAGVLNLEDAVYVVYHRGQILEQIMGKGRMAAVEVSLAEAKELIKPYGGRLSVAAINSPTGVTLSGEKGPLYEVLKKISHRGVFQRILQVNYPFHSQQVLACQAEMVDAVKDIIPKAPQIPIISTVTGRPATEQDYGAEYWGKNIRQTVQFASAVDTLIDSGHRTFLEISPHSVLMLSISQCLAHRDIRGITLASLQRKKKDRLALLETLGALYIQEHKINWTAVYPRPARHVRLPSYPWQRIRHWIDGDYHRKLTAAAPRSQETDIETSSSLFGEHQYKVVWKTKKYSIPPGKTHTDGPIGWLIFSDGDGVGDQLAKLFHSAGHKCILVEQGETYDILGENKYSVNPSRYEDYLRLIQEVSFEQGIRFSGAIHLWGISSTISEETDPEQMNVDSIHNCSSAVYLARIIANMEIENPPPIWLITRGAQPITSNSSLPAITQSPLWGLGRVLALELPGVWGGMIDLDPDMDPGAAAERLHKELINQDGEDQVAFRQHNRYVARLIRNQEESPKQMTCRIQKKGTYLVTGGLGGLGLKVARWLADQGAGHIVLMSRRGLPVIKERQTADTDTAGIQKLSIIKEIEELDVHVDVVSADVGDIEQMTSIISKFGKTMPPLRGIIHAAGTIAPTSIDELDVMDFTSAFQPKLQGTWVLHQLTKNLNLDFFILFSSAASVLGAKDLAHYAAANHFLDAFAHYCRLKNLPVTSINWGWWAGGWSDEKVTKHFTKVGLHSMPDEAGLAFMGAMLGTETIQTIFADFDWNIFAPIYEAKKRRPFLDEIRETLINTEQQESEAASGFMKKLSEAQPGDRLHILQDYIQKEVARLLGFPNPTQLDSSQGFFHMGMDSIKAVQLKARLESTLGRSLQPTIAFEYPNIVALSSYLVEAIFHRTTPAVTAGKSKNLEDRTAIDAEREKLSEEELINLISNKLKKTS